MRVFFLSCLWFLCCVKVLRLNYVPFVYLFIFVFIFITRGGGSKRILLLFTLKSVLPLFPVGVSIACGLTFRSLIHCEFVFVCGVRKCSNFILFHGAVLFSQHHLLKRLSFLHLIFSSPLSKISGWASPLFETGWIDFR